MVKLKIKYEITQEVEAIVRVPDKEYNQKKKYGIGYLDGNDLQTDTEGFAASTFVDHVSDDCVKIGNVKIIKKLNQ